jgi:hypothetical protein
MLRGIESNRIIVGAYVDKESGGICPMLAAHRNGGRTSLASFARAWDRYTGAKRPRVATRRELRTLRALLETSLASDDFGDPWSIAEAATQIRTERVAIAERATREPAEAPADEPIRIRLRHDTGERHRAAELRDRPRWSWLRPAREYDEFKDLLAAAEEQLSEQQTSELLGDVTADGPR